MEKNDSTIVECPYCEAKVNAKIIAEKEYPPGDDNDPYRFVFMECPVCDQALVGSCDLIQVDSDVWDWSAPLRLWPDPHKDFDFNIPRIVRSSLGEAKKCYKAKAFSACAVMCGKAIEGICIKETNAKTLHTGLKKLKDIKIIDDRLFEWGEALRKERNIGAHATGQELSKQDARDVLDFSVAICDYVYVLSKKYSEYQERKSKQ